ncbi:MAG: DbpA RNA binding domain-containing protein [Gemmatimonadales bacterium]
METIEREPAPGGDHTDRTPDPTLAAEIAPTIERGRNLIAIMPPAAGYATPALAALGRRATGGGSPVLVLAGEAMLDAVGRAAARSPNAAGRVHIAGSTGRAISLLEKGQVTTLVTTPETALDLITRSALHLAEVAAVFLAWPETWLDETPLVSVMQDLPGDCQRVLYTASLDQAVRLGERYLRKALTLGAPPLRAAGQGTQPGPAGPVTVAVSPADRLVTAVFQVIDLLDPTDAVVWTATGDAAAAIREGLEHRSGSLPVVQGEIPKADLIVAAELPSPELLGKLVDGSKRLVVVSPTWGLAYMDAHAGKIESLRLPGTVEAVNLSLQADRRKLEALLDAWEPPQERALYALAPLLERHDPARVAAVLYQLWKTRPQPTPTPDRAPAGAQPTGRTRSSGRGQTANTVRIFVNAGKKDHATPADFVAMLTKDIKVPRQDIGRIELQETFSLIELPAGDAQRIARALTGKTLRRRDLVARLERSRR